MSFNDLVVSCFVIYLFIKNSCSEVNLTCNQKENSHKNKFNDSPVVAIGKFLEFIPNGKDATVQNAKFKLEKRLKGSLLHGTDGTFNVPLYRGHNTMSKNIYCLSEKILKKNERYVLFLNHETNTKSNELMWKSLFMVEKYNENEEKMMYDLEVPYFELQVSTASDVPPDSPVKKRAEIRVGDPLYFRCTIIGETHNEPSISWNHDGSEVEKDVSDKRIEIDNATLTSTLKIDKFEPSHKGTYECSARRKDGKKQKTKMKIEIKTDNYSTIFNEQLCGPQYNDYCKHGGVCLIHKQTKTVSCRCTSNYFGKHCEFYFTDVHDLGAHDQVQAQHNKNVITVGCVIGLALILAFASVLLFLKRRSLKNPGSRNPENASKTIYPVHLPKINGQLQTLEDGVESNFLLPQCCPLCHQEINGNHRNSSQTWRKSPIPRSPAVRFGQKIEISPAIQLMKSESALSSADCRSHSMPGFFKMGDTDSPKGEILQIVPLPYTNIVKLPKVRHLGTSEDDLESPVLYDRLVKSDRRSHSIPEPLVSNNTNLHSSLQKELSISEPNSPITSIIMNGKNRELNDSKNESVILSLADD